MKFPSPVFAMFAVLVLASCSSTVPTEVKSTNIEPQTKAVTDGKLLDLPDLSIVLPNGWETINFSDKQMMDGLESAWSKDSPMRAMLPQIKTMAASGSIKGFAFDKSTVGTGFATNVNIIVLDQVAVTLDKLIELNQVQLKSMANGDLSTRKLKGTNCEVAVLDWATKNGDKVLHFFTCIAVKGTKNYTVTFTSLDGTQGKLKGDVETAVGSITLK